MAAADNKPQVSDTDVRKIIERLSPLLSPFIDTHFSRGEGKEERESHLTTVIRCAAKLGLMLFSQPTAWAFEWEIPCEVSNETGESEIKKYATSTRGVVVYPAIWQTSDIDGRELPSAELKEGPELDSSPSAIQCTVAAERSFSSFNSLLPTGAVTYQEADTVREMTAMDIRQGEQRQDRKREQASTITERVEKYSRTADGSENQFDGQRWKLPYGPSASGSSLTQDLISQTPPAIPRKNSVAKAASHSARAQHLLGTKRSDTSLGSSYSSTSHEDMSSGGGLERYVMEENRTHVYQTFDLLLSNKSS